MGRWVTIKGKRVYLSESNDLTEALKEHFGAAKRKTIFLPKKEYAHVMSEINTWYDEEKFSSIRILSKPIGNYVYTFENFGYNEYRFIHKVLIKELEGENDE